MLGRMRAPPRITRAEVVAVQNRIAKRRDKDDPDLEKLGDPDQAHPREVLEFVIHRPHRDRTMRARDSIDGLTLNAAVWWIDREVELKLLRRGLIDGCFPAELGLPLGITTAQGTQDRIDRLTALLAGYRPDEKISREHRRLDTAKAEHGDARQAWIAVNRRELELVARLLLGQAAKYAVTGEDAEFIEELADDVEQGSWSPASLSVLSLAATELQTHPNVLVVPEADGQTRSRRERTVDRVIRRAKETRLAFDQLTPLAAAQH